MEKRKKKNNYKKILSIILTLLLIFSNIFMIYAVALYKIETQIRIVGCLTIIVLSTLLWTLLIKFSKYKKQKLFIFLSILCLLYSVVLDFVAFKANNIYSTVASISSNKYSIYSTSIITRKDDSKNTLDNIKNGKIGIINQEADKQGYDLSIKILNDKGASNTIRYNSYEEILKDLLNKKIDYALVPTHYESMVSGVEGLENISEETQIIYTEEKKTEKKVTTKNNKSIKKPFTVLVMGVDTVDDGFSAGFNGDALLLATFNPETTNTTILSIPRDSYMPITCLNNRKNKITNAGWHGEECIISSLENFLDITIDYHVKINFNGVVQLVDALGGVEVDVPYSFCEQNSKREWGKNTIFVNSGTQKLNGEQALAFARHRKVTQYMVNYCGSKYVTNANYWNDFARGQHQQVIINALLNKLKTIDSFSTIEKVLDTISKNIETDISTDNIFSLYNIGKSIITKSGNKDDALSMQKLYLEGHDARIYDYSFKTNSGSRLSLYNYSIYKESKEAVVNAMKENLGLKESVVVKEFSYSIKEEDQDYVIGKNEGTTSDLVLLPNFIGQDISVARNFASKNGINLDVEYVTGYVGQRQGQILKQDIPATTDIDMLNSSKTVKLTVVESVRQAPTQVPTQVEESKTNTEEKVEETQNTETNVEEVEEQTTPEEVVQQNQEPNNE